MFSTNGSGEIDIYVDNEKLRARLNRTFPAYTQGIIFGIENVIFQPEFAFRLTTLGRCPRTIKNGLTE